MKNTIINLTPPIDWVQYGISETEVKDNQLGLFYNTRLNILQNCVKTDGDKRYYSDSRFEFDGNTKQILFSTNPKDLRFPYLVMPSKEQEVERLALEYTNATRERRALYGTVYSAFKTGFNANKGIYTQEQSARTLSLGNIFEEAKTMVYQSLQPTAKAVRVEMEEILATAGEYEEAGTVRIGYEIKLEKSKEHPQGVIKALEVIY